MYMHVYTKQNIYAYIHIPTYTYAYTYIYKYHTYKASLSYRAQKLA